MKYAILALLATGAAAHGSMTHPRPRNAHSSPGTAPSSGSDLSCEGDACYWYMVGCMIGCPRCQLESAHKGCGSELCCTPAEGLMEPTNNDPEFRTWDPYSQYKDPDQHKYNPWRAPGKAPVADPCGVASGSNDPSDYDALPQGYRAGDKGSEVLPEQEATVWQAGGTATVGWALSAQHSGGYSYRLCPKSSTLTEDCFQSNVLSFASANSTIHYNDGSRADAQIVTRTYVAPDGSQWRTNPIPACVWAAVHGTPTPNCPSGTMFETYSFVNWTQGFLVDDKNKFSVMDEVTVPNTPGEYVLGWRWDCESADQVWASCSDILIVDAPVPAPSPRPVPADPTCPHFTAGDDCATNGCATVDESGSCLECCEGCVFLYNVHGSTCRNGGKKPSPSPGPKPDQCASRDPSMKFGCYYQGCKTVDADGKCTECCDGCHLEHDVTKGDICMEDGTDFLQPLSPKPDQCASRDPSMKFGCYYQGCKTVDADGKCTECCNGCHLEHDVTKGDICMEDSTDLLQPPGPKPDQCASRDKSMKFGCYYQGCKTVDAAGTCTECCDGCHLEHDVTKGDICMEDSTDLLQPPEPETDQCASRDKSSKFNCHREGCKRRDAAGTCTECCDGCHLKHYKIKGDICMEDNEKFLASRALSQNAWIGIFCAATWQLLWAFSGLSR